MELGHRRPNRILKKQKQELQDIIDIIIATARLIGYTIERQTIVQIKHPDGKKAASMLVYISPKGHVRLLTTINDKKTILENENQQLKIDHLNDLLQSL